MSQIKESVDVEVPVSVAYNQWTQFEDFPYFMEGVEEVRQVTDDRLHWKAEIAGQEREWDARITEQVPDQRIAWMSEGGEGNAGVVTFHPIDDNTTRVMLQLDYAPEGMIEKAGDMLGMVKRRASGDMKRFKDFIEGRGRETGAWRGNIS